MKDPKRSFRILVRWLSGASQKDVLEQGEVLGGGFQKDLFAVV